MTRKEIINILKNFKAQNKQKYLIRNIGLFGSVARDTSTEISDIDVFVELEKQDLFNIIGIKQDLEERFKTNVDVVSYRVRMNSFLKKRIEEEGIYV